MKGELDDNSWNSSDRELYRFGTWLSTYSMILAGISTNYYRTRSPLPQEFGVSEEVVANVTVPPMPDQNPFKEDSKTGGITYELKSESQPPVEPSLPLSEERLNKLVEAFREYGSLNSENCRALLMQSLLAVKLREEVEEAQGYQKAYFEQLKTSGELRAQLAAAQSTVAELRDKNHQLNHELNGVCRGSHTLIPTAELIALRSALDANRSVASWHKIDVERNAAELARLRQAPPAEAGKVVVCEKAASVLVDCFKHFTK